MGTENESVRYLGNKRKHNTHSNYPKLLAGDKVEIRSVEKGYEGSWHPGTVIECREQARQVQYDHRLCIDSSNKLIKIIKVPPILDGIISATNIHRSDRGSIRPIPPPLAIDENTLHYGQCVDAYRDEAWWEGVIFDDKDGSKDRLIFFPDMGHEMGIMSKNLRITQDWDEFLGYWKPRGSWFFLELIEEIQQEWPLPVSIKQIWSQVKENESFKRQIKRWTASMKYDLWRSLVWEAFSDNFKLSFELFLKETNMFGDVDDNSQLLVSEASLDDILKPKPNSGCVGQEPVVPLKTPGGKPKSENIKRKTMWLPAGSDIVPGPEFCPDSVKEFIHEHNCKKRCSEQLRLKIKKHLLFLGWKIKFSRIDGHLNFRYISPDGKSHKSLSKVCKYLNTEYSDSNSKSKIKEFPSDGSDNSTRKTYKKRRHMSEPTSTPVIPEAEFCPDAIREYNLHSGGNKRAAHCLVLNVRKHLAFLGWKIELLRYASQSKIRYKSPDGTYYESLPKALQSLSETTDTFSVPCQNKADILPDLSDKPHSSPSPDKSPASVKDLDIVPPDTESEYFPEAIKKYYFLSSVDCGKTFARNHYSKTFTDPENLEVKMKAKQHLAALGWSFWYTTKKRNTCIKRVPMYTSKSGKTYESLRSACKGCIDEGVLCESMNRDQNEKTLSQHMLKSKSCQVETIAIPKVRKGGKKRTHSVMTHGSHLVQKKDKKFESQNRKKSKENRLVIRRKSAVGNCPKSSQRTCKRSQKGGQNTVSCLMDGNVVSPREKVYYVSKQDNCRIGEGVMTRDGIECDCCQEVFTLGNFELHVCKSTHKPEGSIILEDGRSLSDCKSQLKKNDYICSICRYGGELILCDQCPSAFHTKCLGLQCVPDGEWFCPLCYCGFCGDYRFICDTKEFGDEGFLSCDQCEHKYHVGCVRLKTGLKLEEGHKENWFCNERCEQIFLGLEKLLGKPVAVGEENITWTLFKNRESGDGDNSDHDKEALTENYNKLNLAQAVMDECFEPSKDRKTRRDILQDVIFSRWSELKRLNFQGFYTLLLENDKEVISVATLRIHGDKVAEVPLIGTRFQYRRLGMCRILMNEVEKKLMELGVERLVLPAASGMVNTWKESFGFSEMTATERLSFLDYNFLVFEGTTMCQKFLKDIPSPCLDEFKPEQTMMMSSNNGSLDEKSVVSEVVLQADPGLSLQEADPVVSIHEANPVDEDKIAEQGSLE